MSLELVTSLLDLSKIILELVNNYSKRKRLEEEKFRFLYFMLDI